MLLRLLLAVASLQAAPPAANFRGGTVLIAFKDGVSDSTKTVSIAGVGGALVRQMGKGVHMLNVPPGLESRVVQLLLANLDRDIPVNAKGIRCP
jgi:hypothetical protein